MKIHYIHNIFIKEAFVSCNILVVDDSITIQKVIKIALSKYDVDLKMTGSLIEAKSEISKFKPHLMIIDAHLSGVSSAADFQKLATEASAPIILLVGSYESFDDTNFREAGFRYFLKKPFEAQDLLNMVKQASSVAIEFKEKVNEAKASEGLSNKIPPPPSPPLSTVVNNTDVNSNVDMTPKFDISELPPVPPPPNLAAEIPIYTTKESINHQDSNSLSDKVTPSSPLPPPPNDGVVVSSENKFDKLPPPVVDNSIFNIESSEGYQDNIKVNVAQKGKKAFETQELSKQFDIPLPPPPPVGQKTYQDNHSINTDKHNNVDLQNTPYNSSYIEKKIQSDVKDASSIDIYNSAIINELEKIVKKELEGVVKKAVFAYCEEKFSVLAKEVISAEIRRLLEEKTRLLIDV